MSRVELDPAMLMYAFRYALGRSTYAVSDVARALVANREALRPDWRAQIAERIDEAVAQGYAGMAMDVEVWEWCAAAMRLPVHDEPDHGPDEQEGARRGLLAYMEQQSEERWAAQWMLDLHHRLVGDETYDLLRRQAGGTWTDWETFVVDWRPLPAASDGGST